MKSWRKRKSQEKGRLRENTIDDSQANRKKQNTRRRIFRTAVGADVASREGNEERTVGKLQRETSTRNPYRTIMFTGDEKERKRLSFVLARERE